MSSSKGSRTVFKKFKRFFLAGGILIVVLLIVLTNQKNTNLTFDQAYTARVDGLLQESNEYNNLLTNLSSSKQTTSLSLKADNKNVKGDLTMNVEASANSKTLQGSSLIKYDASFEDNSTSQKFESTGSVVIDNIGQNVYATIKAFNLKSSDDAFVNALVKTYIDKPIILPITQELSGSLQAQQIVTEFAKLPGIIRKSFLENPIFKPVGTKLTINGKSVYQVQIDQTGMKKVIDTLSNNPSIQQAFNISAGEITFEDLAESFSGSSFLGQLVIRDMDDVSLSIQSIESAEKDIMIKADLYAFDGFISIVEKTFGGEDTQTIQLDRDVSTFGAINIQGISYTNNNISKPDIKADVDVSVSLSDDSFSSKGDGSVTFPLSATSTTTNPEPLTLQFDRSSKSTKADNLTFTEPTNAIRFEDLFGGLDGSESSEGFDSMGVNPSVGNGSFSPDTSSETIEELNIGNTNP